MGSAVHAVRVHHMGTINLGIQSHEERIRSSEIEAIR